jgi:hypothetical protein
MTNGEMTATSGINNSSTAHLTAGQAGKSGERIPEHIEKTFELAEIFFWQAVIGARFRPFLRQLFALSARNPD